MTTGSVWKAEEKFVIQFNGVSQKDKRFILKTLQDWKESGFGYQKDGTEVLIFSNKALDEKSVRTLVKNMPFPFTEEKKNGTKKVLRTKYKEMRKGLTARKKSAKIGEGRACSNCGICGHNSRTCER